MDILEIVDHRSFPKQPHNLKEKVASEGFETIIDIEWRSPKSTNVVRYNFVNSTGQNMYYYFYFDNGENLIVGTKFV